MMINEQKQIEKNTLKTRVCEAKPYDYADRNSVYKTWLGRIGWLLQATSVIASSYLIYDVLNNIFEIGYFNAIFYAVVSLCVALFTFIESVRRWLIDTIGYHFMATFNVLPNKTLKNGEILKVKFTVLIVISVVMITTGVTGVYEFIYDISPKAKTHDVKTVTKTAVSNIDNQTSSVKEADKQVSLLQTKINNILNDYSNYNVWKGTKYLTTTADANVKAFTSQLAAITSTKIKSLDIIAKNQDRANILEDKTEATNRALIEANTKDKTQLAIIALVIWLFFEFVLLLCLSFIWIYRYNVKYETQTDIITKGVSLYETKTNNTKSPITTIISHISNKTPSVINSVKRIGGRFNVKRQNQGVTAEVTTPLPKNAFSVVGFETGINVKPFEQDEVTETPRTIVVVNKEVRVEKDGFECRCLTCGKVRRTKRPAKFCTDTKDESGKKTTSKCRNTWHHAFTREQRMIRWVEYGYDIKDFE